MDRAWEFQGTTFLWNAEKARSNLVRHGVAFEEAAMVFFDPFLRMEDATLRGELRYAAIGLDEAQRLLYLVHIEFQDEAIRIISARRATRKERQSYDS
jgi:uncharacterized DUF497 family protein